MVTKTHHEHDRYGNHNDNERTRPQLPPSSRRDRGVQTRFDRPQLTRRQSSRGAKRAATAPVLMPRTQASGDKRAGKATYECCQ